MRRREILVFVAAFAVVLLGGAALAQVGTFASAPSAEAAAGETVADTEAPETEKSIETTAAKVSSEEDSNKESEKGVEHDDEKQPSDPPKDEEPPADPPKDEKPPAEDADTTPPPLEILFPENDQHFDEKQIAFEGTTEPGARVFGGKYEAEVGEDGEWRIVLILSPGGNLVTFKAKDQAGNITEKTVKVYLDKEEATDKEFTANQKWEVVDGHPAKNKYFGTGTPGTKVWVGSEYGDGSTKIGEDGEWLFYVEFPNAPCNERFTVVVESGDHRREFKMKYACGTHEFSATQKYGENESKWTKFYGTGQPGDKIHVVSEFGSTETTVESNGEWYAKLHFNDNLPANTEIQVVVEASSGGRAEFDFYWIVKEVADVDFTANQKYGSCDAEVPYDKFFGTANPGTQVWVESDFGGGTTTADKNGNWFVEVQFPNAPVGDPFTVFVDSEEGSAEFQFVRTGDGTK